MTFGTTVRSSVFETYPPPVSTYYFTFFSIVSTYYFTFFFSYNLFYRELVRYNLSNSNLSPTFNLSERETKTWGVGWNGYG